MLGALLTHGFAAIPTIIAMPVRLRVSIQITCADGISRERWAMFIAVIDGWPQNERSTQEQRRLRLYRGPHGYGSPSMAETGQGRTCA